MPLLQHFAHIYQRPKAGSAFIDRYPVFNYQHTICNRGWFDTASCDVMVRSESQGQRILEQFLGCFIAFYVDNPAQPIWEGLINRITFNAGGASYTISLDEMANRVSVVYTGASNVAAETTIVNNTASQAIYGIKQEQIEFGGDPSAATQKTTLRDTILAQRAYPQSAITQAQGNSNLVRLECIGIYQTLEWSKQFTALLNTTLSIDASITAYVQNNANLATFFDSTNVSKISANAVTTPVQQRGQSYWDIIVKNVEAGDGTNYWVCGILPTDYNTGKRLFYYRVANSAVEYTAYKADGLRPRTINGRLVRPWLVTPDRGIRVNDALLGYGGSQLADPTITYIQRVQYDANSQRVQWFGADDTTARAAFLLNRGFKPLSQDFGAPLRTIVT